MNKFTEPGSQSKIYLLIETLSSLSTLAAIRSAMTLTLPLAFLGSLATLLNNFPLPAYQSFMQSCFGPDWKMLGQALTNSTFSVISLVLLFLLGQSLAAAFNKKHPFVQISPVVSGLVALTSYLVLLQAGTLDILPNHWLGVPGMFMALLVGLLSTKIFFTLFRCERLRINLPIGTIDATTPLVFNALLPAILAILFFALLGATASLYSEMHIAGALHQSLRIPFDYIGDSFSRSILYVFSVDILWFFGVHGANVLDPITHNIFATADTTNMVALAFNMPLQHFITKNFTDIFVFMGGAGSTLSLVGALLLFGKANEGRRLGALALIPCLFNINEVLLLGLPIILNPVMLIPFILTPIVLACVSYVAVLSGVVSYPATVVEWITPVFFNSYISTGSISGPILQMVNLSIGILIYTPFVLLSKKLGEKRFEEAFRKLLQRACSPARELRLTAYNDNAGALARNMLSDMSVDCRTGKNFFLEFQPQIAAASSRVVGVESLLRWHSASYGLVPAPIAVALAEDSGLIRPLGLHIIDRACHIRRQWLDKGISDIVLAINLSTYQLTPDFSKNLKKIFHNYQLQPRMIELEVTESGALDEGSIESKVLSELHDYGFGVAIDDFGMGHTSLKYLKQFPVSTVKLDGAIIREVLTNPICINIVASISKLCRALKITIVAEFVETEAQANLLRKLGCDIFQGYHYAKPLSAEHCLEFIQENHKENRKEDDLSNHSAESV